MTPTNSGDDSRLNGLIYLPVPLGRDTLHAARGNLLKNFTKMYFVCPNQLRLSTDTRYQLASDPVDERWIGEEPTAHGPKAKKGIIC